MRRVVALTLFVAFASGAAAATTDTGTTCKALADDTLSCEDARVARHATPAIEPVDVPWSVPDGGVGARPSSADLAGPGRTATPPHVVDGPGQDQVFVTRRISWRQLQ